MQRSVSGLQKGRASQSQSQPAKQLHSSASLTLHNQAQSTATITKEKNNAALKKMVREANIEKDQLKSEIQRLKHTMKFTRLNEITSEN